MIHYAHSKLQAADTQRQVETLGRRAWICQADLEQPGQAAELVGRATQWGTVFALVNNAAVFETLPMQQTDLRVWGRQLAVNLTAPFALTQAFAAQVPGGGHGRVVNILDWRALRPDNDHFAYSVTKAGLAAMTRSAALALAPAITVNGLALGAILPPEGESGESTVLDRVPAQRWGRLDEVEQALLFLLAGPAYITGEIIHVDGGRQLV